MIAKSIQCTECGNSYFETEEKCKNCGAPNPHYQKADTDDDNLFEDGENSFDQKMEDIRNKQISHNKYTPDNPYTGR